MHAAELAETYRYGVIIMTDGAAPHNPRLSSWSSATEAEHFADVFLKHTKQHHDIVLEKEACNTGQNALYSYQCLRRMNVDLPETIQLVTKPYMERRAVAAFEKQWPDKNTEFFVSSAPKGFARYCTEQFLEAEATVVMLKDFISLEVYGAKGWQTRQQIPDGVAEAANFLQT